MRSIHATLLVLGLLAGAARSQDADEVRAKELQAKIKKDMAAIDEMLLQAEKGAPAAAREKVEQVRSDLEKLFKDVQGKQSAVCSDIEELIRMAKAKQSKKGGSGDRQQQPQSGEMENEPTERSQEPEPEQLQKQEPGEQQQKGESRPEDGQADAQRDPRQQGDAEKPPGETGRFERSDTAGRWGVLPPKVAEQMQRLGEAGVPERYRELIMQYHRRQASEGSRKPPSRPQR